MAAELSASFAPVPEDVSHATARFRVRTVMAVRARGEDRWPRVQFHGELQAPSGNAQDRHSCRPETAAREDYVPELVMI